MGLRDGLCARGWLRWLAHFVFLGALLAGLSQATTRQAGADPAVAQILIEQGRKAITQRNFAEAVQRLERACTEDPAQIEALYLLGTVYEKTKEPSKALAAYRSFRDLGAEQARVGALDKRLQPLQKKAQERIGLLGKGEAELEALQGGFAQKVLAFARSAAKDDPDLCQHALTRLLEVSPGQAEAQELLGRLGGEAKAAPGDKAPIPGITRWTDLIATRALLAGDRVTYGDIPLVIDAEGGSIFWTEEGVRAEEPAVLEIEFRCAKAHASGWLVGVAFGRGTEAEGRQDEFVTVFAQDSKVVTVLGTGGRQVDLGTTVVPPLGDRWHRLAAGMEQGKVRVFFDGKRLASLSVSGRDALDGEIGVFHQRCRAEFRVLRLGSAK